jgi:hypothetical protein
MIKPFDPKSIPKYVNQLVIPPVYLPTVILMLGLLQMVRGVCRT